MKRFRYVLAAILAGLVLSPIQAGAASKAKAHHEQSDKRGASAKNSAKDSGKKAGKQDSARGERSSAKADRSKAGKERAGKEETGRKDEKARDSRRADKTEAKDRRERGGRREPAESRDAQREAGARCTSKRVKEGRRTRTVKVCEKLEPALQSPIRNTDIEKPAPEGKETEIKARTVPERAYAVDGRTFFFQGRKYRAAGLTGIDGSEMAKQRLQRALDVGGLSVEPLSVDEAGVSTANVRVNGRSLQELLPQP